MENRIVWYNSSILAEQQIVQYHILELPKVKTGAMPASDEQEKRLIQWLRFFKAKTEEDFMVLARESSILEKAFQILMIASGSQRMKAIYDEKRKEEATLYFMQNRAYTQGRDEKARETAQKMKTEGMIIVDITKYTELSPEVIEEL